VQTPCPPAWPIGQIGTRVGSHRSDNQLHQHVRPSVTSFFFFLFFFFLCAGPAYGAESGRARDESSGVCEEFARPGSRVVSDPDEGRFGKPYLDQLGLQPRRLRLHHGSAKLGATAGTDEDAVRRNDSHRSERAQPANRNLRRGVIQRKANFIMSPPLVDSPSRLRSVDIDMTTSRGQDRTAVTFTWCICGRTLQEVRRRDGRAVKPEVLRDVVKRISGAETAWNGRSPPSVGQCVPLGIRRARTSRSRRFFPVENFRCSRARLAR